jgi:hypothetical protein
LAKFLTPLATSIQSGGFQTGLKPGVINVATKGVGGGVVGGASAAAVNPEDAEMGAAIGAAVPTVIAPLVGKVVNYGRKIADLKSATYLDAVEGRGRNCSRFRANCGSSGRACWGRQILCVATRVVRVTRCGY